MKFPREPGTKARLSIQSKPYCEAFPGVADPITTLVLETWRLYPGGRAVSASRKAGTQQSSTAFALSVWEASHRCFAQAGNQVMSD
jgi:hypothetical protein